MEDSNQISFEALFKKGNLSKIVGSIVTGTVIDIAKDYIYLDIGFKSVAVCEANEFYDPGSQTLSIQRGSTVEVLITGVDEVSGRAYASALQAKNYRAWQNVLRAYENGESVRGKVIMKVKGGLQVDIGIPAFLPQSQVDIVPIKNLDKFIGEEIECKITKINEGAGNIVLSRKAHLQAKKEELKLETLKLLQEGLIVEGTVKSLTDYGAFVDIGGVEGLLHLSDISWGRINHPSEKLEVGQKIVVVVLKYDAEKERINLGLKQLQADPWISVHEKYFVGSKVTGKAVEVTPDGGIILEVEEGIEAYVPASELSWTKKVPNVSRIVSEREKVDVVITAIDENINMLRASIRQLYPNPWEELQKKFQVGSRVKAPITSVTDFGIFVRLTDDIDGLVHVSDFSWTQKIQNPKQIYSMYKKGQEVEVMVLEIDPVLEKVSLGIKQLTPDPWPDIVARYPKGRKLKVKVKQVLDFGVIVQLEPELDGFIHVSELDLPKGEIIKNKYPEGAEIEAEVIKVDNSQRRIGLSEKALKRKEVEGVSSFSGSVTFLDILKQKLQKE
ncbi:MAG: 30S ribosomal protein S1 [Deltaproteobacteria bacterium]|nr:30S ribosomal protein S1 [Deltaproteobacteria bacterium]MCX7952246.1 30S ribosomal protein S1 [Deltaproteobacteria bacterium]